jgi:hypothetical protein
MIIPVSEMLSNISVTLSFDASTCNDLHQCRTIWNIIWSSLVTLFACIWLSIHPNIPAPQDSWGTRIVRRVWMMALALIAPELVVGWAARQWIHARKIAKENDGEVRRICQGWTRLMIICHIFRQVLDRDPRVLCFDGWFHAIS